MPWRTIAILVGVMTIVSSAGGCGGSGSGSAAGNSGAGGSESSGGQSAAPLTKAEFIKQGDEICEQGREQVEGSTQVYLKENTLGESSEPNPAQLEEILLKIVLPSLQSQAEGLGQLSPPKGEEARVEAIVKGIESAVSESAADPSRARNGNNPFIGVAKLFNEYGFKVCGG